jgi:hypothetical protein
VPVRRLQKSDGFFRLTFLVKISKDFQLWDSSALVRATRLLESLEE